MNFIKRFIVRAVKENSLKECCEKLWPIIADEILRICYELNFDMNQIDCFQKMASEVFEEFRNNPEKEYRNIEYDYKMIFHTAGIKCLANYTSLYFSLEQCNEMMVRVDKVTLPVDCFSAFK